MNKGKYALSLGGDWPNPERSSPLENSGEIHAMVTQIRGAEDIALEQDAIEIQKIKDEIQIRDDIVIGEPHSKVEILSIGGEKIEIHYVTKEQLAPAFGCCYENGYIEVRADLPEKVKKFVRSHELYHHFDNSHWGGWLGAEFRANFFPGLRDPVGLFATLWLTLTSKERMSFYLDRFKRKY